MAEEKVDKNKIFTMGVLTGLAVSALVVTFFIPLIKKI